MSRLAGRIQVAVLAAMFIGLLTTSRVTARADEQQAKTLAAAVVKANGGEANLLRKFKMTELLNVSSNPEGKANQRVSVLEPPAHWWLGKKDRVVEEKEPATYLVWAWTLGPLVDAKSKLESVAEVTESDRPLVGLRVSESITPAMDLYFDKETLRLVRIDWRSDIHRFSDWKEFAGATCPTKCVGYKKASGKPWYFTTITALERVAADAPQ
ncbi:MAG TPA: hypothetical protein PLV92_17625 [Pirellulaceae bacterium]|nr:hypothetical protein [Pirellulaceae bacterium]